MTNKNMVFHADGCSTNLGIIGATCNCGAEAQAKITWDIAFKAGQQEGISLERQGAAFLEGKLSGMKEVVEWIVSHKRGYYAKPDGTILAVTSAEWTEAEWQKKLKEWEL